MYENYWRLHRKPFENTPDPEFLYYTQQHEEALMRLLYTIKERKGAAILTGEYGSGKTTITRALVSTVRQDQNCELVLIANPNLSATDFLAEILFQLKVGDVPSKKVLMLRKLEEVLLRNFKNHQKTVIVVDEAQNIKRREILEELRMLLNYQLNDQFLLTLILVGQPEIKEKLNQIKQFKQRLSIRYYLRWLTEEETKKYIEYRLKIAGRAEPLFSEESIRMIHSFSKGAPRDINNICDMGLLLGSMRKSAQIDETITTEVVEDMIKDFD